MKLSEIWLREWVNPSLTREQLCSQLTMAGLEVEELAPVAEQFTGVVVAKVLSVDKHPEADRLQVCQVDVGGDKPLNIVCGAKNVKPGMKAPAALENAILANKTKIKLSKIRGVVSQGMLCSAMELGLSEQSEGLLQLPHDAPVGENIWDYLKLTDYVIDVAITPNRGDCLSVIGLAKEISAITNCSLHIPNIVPVKPLIQDKLDIAIETPVECPRYVGRIIRGVKADAHTPMWIQERLRRSGMRSISPVVDVMNYVMLELGQPMHAFDLQKIAGKIVVRMASPGENLKLLDGQEVTLIEKGETLKLAPQRGFVEGTMIIADSEKPLAIAGVMGGLDSGVTLLTQDIFLESAYFQPVSISKTVRRFNLGSESSYRFERGIDPTIQVLAIERATELLLEIVGGQPGPVIEVSQTDTLPKPIKIALRKERVGKVLGLTIFDHEIEKIFERLRFSVEKDREGWIVTVTSRRSDISKEVDLIEEIARLYGYEKIPVHKPTAFLQIHSYPEQKLKVSAIRAALRDQGFNEVVTYSFIDKQLQSLFDPDLQPKELVNPITAEMSVMRTSLWPGLINTLLYNQNRQQNRIRIFEIGLRFISQERQEATLSGLVSGPAFPEQWGVENREVDFFDLKGDLQNLFYLTHGEDTFKFEPHEHPALHPGKTAAIFRNNKAIGVMGALHPSILQKLDLPGNVYVFELLIEELQSGHLPHFADISKFPEIRRDIALLVDRTVPIQVIQDTIREVAGPLLRNINLFDVYQGKGIPPDRKSVALALTLQHASRTLRDEEVAELIERVIVALKDQFAAELRS